ncbi:hypothetical protein [Rhodopseudomonas palustris]|uniref:hypothetical protein n=1 Tax=Rhodopseudomonas palustris TaxID=1076 RepID=UPI0021F36EF1|nr:hypothetical protein [Rhodopseudomonas palustris]UYO54595.1 hypothetical protein KQX61_04005 [Rhodopseudomonas palustris]
MSQFPSDRLAALLAHALNVPAGEICVVDPGALYSLLAGALAKSYRDALLNHSTYADRMSIEEAATKYLAATIERRLWLSNKVDESVAHRLLLVLCQRAVGGAWAQAQLVRNSDQPDTCSVRPLASKRSFDFVVAQLARLPAEVSPGNPAATIQQRKGRLWLLVGQNRIALPEEISSWDAIECCPRQLVVLAKGEPFNRFCAVLIDAMRTANRPFQELLGLGRSVCPFDWIDVLSTNQVRSLRKFLQEVASRGTGDSLEVWKLAWEAAPVAGFKSAEDMWASDIGRALRQPRSRQVEVSVEDLSETLDDNRDFLGRDEFFCHIGELQEEGVISSGEKYLIERIYDGETLDTLSSEPIIRNLLQEHRMKLPQLVAAMQRKLLDWHRKEESCHA